MPDPARAQACAERFLAGYPQDLRDQISQMIASGKLGSWLLERHGGAHVHRSEAALYDHVMGIKQRHLRSSDPIAKVAWDPRLQIIGQALGMHTTASRVQGSRLKAKREIRISTLFRDAPLAFLDMICVHELAHLKVREHDKAFYQLCIHMAPQYHQHEFELRTYLAWLDAGGPPLWGGTAKS